MWGLRQLERALTPSRFAIHCCATSNATCVIHFLVILLHCSALQLPPEAWLRFCPFNCSLTYLTIRPTGSVGCRLLGDIGHLPYNTVTFSKHHGYNW